MRPLLVIPASLLVPIIVFALTCSSAAAGEPGGATLLYGGRVFTGSSDAPDATWIALRGDRIAAVGQGAGVPEAWAGAEIKVDLAGRFVLPGFVDAHVHFVDGGLSLLQTDLNEVRSPEELEAALRRARERPIGGWVLARGLDLLALGGELPNHENLGSRLGSEPAFVALKSGHHFYVNPAGLDVIGVDRDTEDPERGRVARDERGEPTGLLVDMAGWDALRAVYDGFGLDLVARAILVAEQRALSYGIVAIGDNTFFPVHAAQMLRLSRRGHLKLRISTRSFGPVEDTRFLMKNLGVAMSGESDARVRFFGAKHFMDGSLSMSTEALGERRSRSPGDPVHMSEDDATEALLFAGSFGTAYHVQGREGVERLLRAREAVGARRRAPMPDVLDHCGSCSEEVAERIAEAGFRVTVLAPQLHEMRELHAAYGDEVSAGLLRCRGLFEAGIGPALTTDWPYGAPPAAPYPADVWGRLGLAPLASIAVAVSGKDPAGEPIAGLEERTVPLVEALRGVTSYGAATIGRAGDLGRLAEGYRADLVVLPGDPFQMDPVELYRLDVDETWIAGERVYRKGDPKPAAEIEAAAAAASGEPLGWTPSPIIGYDPVPGLIVGAALFVHPYRLRGPLGHAEVMVVPFQRARVIVAAELSWRRVTPWLDVQGSAGFVNWKGRYYGAGNDTRGDDYLETDPTYVETSAGVTTHPADWLSVALDGLYRYAREEHAQEIDARSAGAEGPLEGHYLGAKLTLALDDRDSIFSTRRGGRRALSAEGWAVQAGEVRRRLRLGAELSHFWPVYAPDWIFAVRAQGSFSLGDPAYATNPFLGGIDLLRGYLENRFRGHHHALAGAELRFPIWAFVSGVGFAEAGRVWLDDADDGDREIAVVGGGGLRFGLPPDYSVRLRFDVGFGHDEWGVFFAFNEAF